jgi:CO/xanthine dehydrogenase FAD-binding subunit
MSPRFRYLRPGTLKEALDFLLVHGSRTSVLAGGTDLMIAVRREDVDRDFILDVSRLEELRCIDREDGLLSVGAALTYTEIKASCEIRSLAPVLCQAAGCVGSVQIRNKGTLGGNVANASPAADSVPAMLVHKALVRIESAAGSRIIPLEELIVAPYRTILQPHELVARFFLEPLENGWRASFQRIARRRALSVARINAAAVAKLGENGRIADLRLSVGSVLPRPARMISAEEFLMRQVPDLELIREAATLVSREMVRRSGIRHSTEYKRPAVEGLVTKVLTEVLL